ncbi:MAG: NADPH-dependent FMN reductase [Rhizomicrobium sp.]
MIHTSPVLVIVGSVRARRIGLASRIGWLRLAVKPCHTRLRSLISRTGRCRRMTSRGSRRHIGYSHPHTHAWSIKIASAAAFVFVTPQYNWGYPAALKNALDHLYKEWSGKPAMIVSYGGHGGGRAAAQLRQVLEAVHMVPVSPMPALMLARDRIEANDGIVDPAQQFAAHDTELRQAFAALEGALSARTSPTG